MTDGEKAALCFAIFVVVLVLMSCAWCPGPAQLTNDGMIDWIHLTPIP